MSWLTAWTAAPVPLLLAAAAAVAYVLGVRRVRAQGGRWPRGRSIAFLAVGLPAVVLTVSWWPGARSHEELAAYMTQVVVLALLAPAVLVAGAPVRLGREALAGTPAGKRWDALFDSRGLRVLSHPLTTPLLMLALPVVVVFTPVLLLTLQNTAAYVTTQVLLVVVGLVAVLGLVAGQVPDHGVPHAVAAFVAFFELILDAIPGGVLFFTTALVAGGWYARHGGHGVAWASADQRTAGATLWAVGEGIDVPFLAVIVIAWMRADRLEAARVDALLDAQEAAARRSVVDAPGPRAEP